VQLARGLRRRSDDVQDLRIASFDRRFDPTDHA